MRLINKAMAAGAAVFAGTFLLAAPASAQATRTWVSGVGDDVNPCSRTAPCKTFAGAISKTAAGGEINCLDPAGWGTVTITKSMSIVCDQYQGGILNSSTTGVIVNAGVNDVIYLRGLEIFGAGTGVNGIRFIAGGTLIVEDTVIRGSNGSGAFGITFQPSGSSKLSVNNTTIASNGNGITGGGIEVKPSGTGSARVDVKNSRLQNNAGSAIKLDTSNTTSASGIIASIEGTEVSGNGDGISLNTATALHPAIVLVVNSSISNNTGIGVLSNGPSSIARVGNTTITGNNGGVNAQSGAVVLSYGDNRLIGNNINGTFTPPVVGTN